MTEVRCCEFSVIYYLKRTDPVSSALAFLTQRALCFYRSFYVHFERLFMEQTDDDDDDE